VCACCHVNASHSLLRSPGEAVKRFESNAWASGPTSVSAYLAALVATGQLASYANSSTSADALPTLLGQLRERSLGGRTPVALGEKTDRPLHVVMVDGSRAKGPWLMRVAGELATSLVVLFCLSVAWAAGGAALRRAMVGSTPSPSSPASPSSGAVTAIAPSSGSLGSALGGSGGAAFAPKEFIKGEMPEKVR
jgi:ATP-dependent metalloprotease